MNPSHPKQKIDETQKIIFFGCGAVSKCCIYYFSKFFSFNYNQITIIDKDKTTFEFPTIIKAIKKGAKHMVYNITKKNLKHLLDTILKVSDYDIIVDLTTNTPTYDIFKECRLRNLLYINTSIEDDLGININNKCPTDNGIFLQHVNLQSIAEKTSDTQNATTLIEFGMNPGLISVFVKQGIMDIANLKLKHQFMKGIDHIDKKLLLYINTNNHKKLAELLKIRAIHCSEIDTQKPQKNINKKFINTWSCVGLITEGIEPAEIQIGTHEKTIPFSKKNVNEILPQLIMTKKSGQEILCKSIVPLKIHKNKVEFTNITGRCIHHGEGISLNRYLGSFKYAPTMHYVYQLNPITDALLSKTSKENLVKISNDPSKWKVLNMHDDDIKGYDNVGALFIMEEDPIIGKSNKPYCFWTGSILDDKYTKNNLNDKYFGPTIIQVMAGILSGLKWMLNNKNKGLVFGEDVDDNYIIENAKKYLGKYYSGPVTGKSLDSFYLSDLIVKGHDKSNTSIHEL